MPVETKTRGEKRRHLQKNVSVAQGLLNMSIGKCLLSVKLRTTAYTGVKNVFLDISAATQLKNKRPFWILQRIQYYGSE